MAQSPETQAKRSASLRRYHESLTPDEKRTLKEKQDIGRKFKASGSFASTGRKAALSSSSVDPDFDEGF